MPLIWDEAQLVPTGPKCIARLFASSHLHDECAYTPDQATRLSVPFDNICGRLHFCSTMKTATVRDLRNHYTQLLEWIGAGEEIVITQRGKSIARLVPERSAPQKRVDWSKSPAVARDRSKEAILSASESQQILAEAGGKW